MEIWLIPNALVVAGGSVEDAALALRAGPSPRFGLGDVVVSFWLADHQDIAIRSVHRVDVGFIPCVEGFEAFHCGVIWLGDGGSEFLAFVVLELSSDEFDETGFVSEAEGGGVDGDEAAAVLDEFDEVFVLVGLDGVVVGVEEDAIELAEIGDVSEGFFDGSGVVEVDAIAAEGLGDDGVIFVRVVDFAVVAKEENADGSLFFSLVLGGSLREGEERDESEGQKKEKVFHGGWKSWGGAKLCRPFRAWDLMGWLSRALP